MTHDDALEYARLVKVLDLATRITPAVVWPLCLPAVHLFEQQEDTRYACPMCHCYGGHRCSCPVTTAARGLRLRTKGGLPCR